MLAGAVRSYLNRYAVAPGAAPWSSPTTTAPIGPRSTCSRSACSWPPWSMPAPRRDHPLAPALRAHGVDTLAGHVVTGRSAAPALAAVEVMRLDAGRRAGAARRIDCDLLAVSGGWQPALHLHARPARGRSTTPGCGVSRRARRASGNGPRAPPAAIWRSAPASRPASGRRRRRGRDRPRRRHAAADTRLHPRALARGARSLGRAHIGGSRQSLRRLPERRHRRRRGARPSRGLPLGRAPQALHHARHGHRSGQDRQPQRPRPDGRARGPADRSGRHHHLPAALRAGRPSARSPAPRSAPTSARCA